MGGAEKPAEKHYRGNLKVLVELRELRSGSVLIRVFINRLQSRL